MNVKINGKRISKFPSFPTKCINRTLIHKNIYINRKKKCFSFLVSSLCLVY